jgi:hypothetical protein
MPELIASKAAYFTSRGGKKRNGESVKKKTRRKTEEPRGTRSGLLLRFPVSPILWFGALRAPLLARHLLLYLSGELVCLVCVQFESLVDGTAS